MAPCEQKHADLKEHAGWDILMIDDARQSDTIKGVTVEECKGATIITTSSAETAMDVLRTVAVDMIFDFPAPDKRHEAEKFRAYIAAQYPSIRVLNLWTPSRREGEKGNYLLPLFLQKGVDCKAQRRRFPGRTNADGARRHEVFADSEGANKKKSRSAINDGCAA